MQQLSLSAWLQDELGTFLIPLTHGSAAPTQRREGTAQDHTTGSVTARIVSSNVPAPRSRRNLSAVPPSVAVVSLLTFLHLGQGILTRSGHIPGALQLSQGILRDFPKTD